MNILKITLAAALTVCLLGASANAAWTQQAKLTQTGSLYLGISCANDADTAVLGAWSTVGANSLQGTGEVYVRSGTTWTHQATLTASDGAASDQFGTSSAVDGDTVVMGAYGADVGANADQGAAYVYTRSGTTWTQQAKLTASDGAASDKFGGTAGRTLDGDNLLVGGTGACAGYIFVRSGTTWTEQAILTGSDTVAVDGLGCSGGLDIANNTCVIGAYGDDSYKGSAYVFTRSGTTWTQQAKLTASDGAGSDCFGIASAIQGDVCVVGSYKDHVTGSDEGSAYVYTRSGTTWTQTIKLTASDMADGCRFGSSVAIDNGKIVVGAPRTSGGGTAYVFELVGGTWTETGKYTGTDTASGSQFGYSSAISGDTICHGSYGHNSNVGAGYIFVPEPVSLLLFAGLAVPVLARRKRS
jgi:hypothetical protein